MRRPRLFLCIGKTLYSLCRVRTEPVVWRLRKMQRDGDVEAIYDLTNESGEWVCDCACGTYRRFKVCKHKRILKEEGIF